MGPVERAAKRLVAESWLRYLSASNLRLLLQGHAPIDLIVHVGAHFGQEAAFYETLGAETLLWIEADPDTFETLTETLSARPGPTRHLCENALVSAAGGAPLRFHRFNGNGGSSSVYAATDALRDRFPHVHESGEVIDLPPRPLPEILARHGLDVAAARRALLVVDVQGHELEVLKGVGEELKSFALCQCEISRVPLYDGGALFPDVDAHMRAMGFRLGSHLPVQVPRHGDVLYIRG